MQTAVQTVITVTIANWGCVENGSTMVLDVDANNNLVLNAWANTATQLWTLIPNLVTNAASGGYTIYNASVNLSAEQPNAGSQIPLGDDPTPYGSSSYCWTLWPAGSGNGSQLWAIQDSQRGNCMDASGGGCTANTQVLLYGWNGGDNQRWIINPA